MHVFICQAAGMIPYGRWHLVALRWVAIESHRQPLTLVYVGDNDTASAVRQRVSTNQPSSSRFGVG